MMASGVQRIVECVGRYLRRRRGSASVDVAIFIPLMLVPLLNAADLAIYVFDKMQVDIAAHAAADAVHVNCGLTGTPVTDTSRCTSNTYRAAGQSAAQATTLGSSVTLSSAADGYYCVNSSSVLTLVGTAGAFTPSTGAVTTAAAQPNSLDCSSVNSPTGASTAAPGYYLLITASYSYTPIFRIVSIASLLPTPITATAWARLS